MHSSYVLKAAVCVRKTVRSQRFLCLSSLSPLPLETEPLLAHQIYQDSSQPASVVPSLVCCHREFASKSSPKTFGGCSEHAESLQHHQTCYRAGGSSSCSAPLTPLSDPAIPISKAAMLCRTKLACQKRSKSSLPTVQKESSSKPCFVKKRAEVNVNIIKAAIAGLYHPSLGAMASSKRHL